MSTPMTPADAELAAALAAKSHTIRIKAGLKEPVGLAWNTQPALTPENASAHVAAGGNIGVDPGRSRMVLLDAEDALGTAWVQSLGFEPTVITAKSGAGPVLADGKENTKAGGSHTWLQLSEDAPADLGNTPSVITLPNGGRLEVFAAAGVRHVMVPPSRLDEAGGRAYVFTGADIAVAQSWLWDRTVPCPEGAEPLHGVVAPPTPRERMEQTARSVELSDEIDEVPWDQWLAADHRLTPTDEVDGCGCPVWHWKGADHDKSVTLHDGCAVGNGAHIWSNTMIAELGLTGDHVSRLDLACALRTQSRAEVAAAHGIQLGDERGECGAIRPRDYARIAEHFEELGETARAAMYRNAAAVMAAARPTPEQRGETFTSGQVLGAPTMAPRSDEDGTGSDEQPIAPVIPIWTGSVPPAFGGPAAAAMRPHTGAGPFPVHALPKVLRDFAVAVADSMAVPVELVAPMQIAVLAAGCGPCNIYVTDGWEAEPGAVWIMIVSPPSTRKTPVLKVVKAPMEEAVRIINLTLGMRRAELQMEADALAEAAEEAESDAKVAMKQAARELADDPAAAAHTAGAAAMAQANGIWAPPTARGLATDLAAKAAKLKQMAEEAQAAVPPEVEPTFTDATPEAMMELLARQKGRGFLIHPEASEILTAATRTDTRGMETAKFNSAYDEEYISTHRIARGVTEVNRPSMCSLLIVQPDPVKEAYAPRQGGKSKITTNGWSDRQGFVLVPESEADSLRRDRKIDPAARDAYAEAMTAEWVRTHMLAATDREAWASLKFRLTPEAFEVIADHYDLVERIKRQPGTRAEAWGKVIGRAVRIARCFAQLDVVDLGSEVHSINEHHMQAGWEIAHWMMRSFDAATNAPETVTIVELVEQAAAYILEKIPAVGDVIMRPKVRSSKRHGPYVEAALEQLTARGEVEVRGQEIRRVALAAAA
ncbi:DUF3987 domain-containing protein [Mycobacteroides abscessus]|uniref:DUF3987 domain-containing protein n=1 Tax=Mycobacteroides abscessus TaxID=36809 RepID=UPI000E67986C|nr:DUF3987 domain-containing protein [Mycobacteroides abscessus]RIU41036.1 DUF3987 domain-containing protein [Mycobacteroides abscessus]